MRRAIAAVAILALGAGACVRYAMAPAEEAAFHRDADLALRGYKNDPNAPSQYDRGIYCDANDRLSAWGRDVVDAGALIVCHPTPVEKPRVVTCTYGFLCSGNGDCSCFFKPDGGQP